MRPELRIRLLDWLLQQRKAVHEMSLQEIERHNAIRYEGLLARLFLGPRLQLPKIVNTTMVGRHGAIPLRIYYPHQSDGRPLILFFHGGGWVTGSLETHDRLCRRMALLSGATIVAVDYRLAPWNKYPVPLDDCYDALLWAASEMAYLQAANDQLMVMGDSAGGNLAAAVCLRARDQNGPAIHRQILLYPALDGTLSSGSHQRHANAPMLDRRAIEFFRAHYMNDLVDVNDACFSPLLAKSLEHLPSALVVTAEHDPLHDEGRAFADRLTAAGVSVTHQNYPGMIHAFLHFPYFCSGADPAMNAIAEDIRSATGLASVESS